MLAVVLVCIYPFIRNVDDLFNISTELITVTVTIVVVTGEAHRSQQLRPP